MSAIRIEDLPRYTYDDYKNWSDRWELIKGIPYAMAPMPIISHQRISLKIAWQLEELLKSCDICQALMPVDWKIDNETILQPDNLVICHKPMFEAYITKAPTIIFEILSPSTAHKDTTIKFDIYEKEGVKYYIIVDPKDKIAKVYLNKDGKFIKIADATDEKVEFETKCGKIEFDFSKIWE